MSEQMCNVRYHADAAAYELCLTTCSELPGYLSGHPSSVLGMSPTQRGTNLLHGNPRYAEEHHAEEAQPNKSPSGLSRKPCSTGS